MKYKTVKVDSRHGVVETATGLVIKTFPTKKDATELKKLIEDGRAFEGFTPPFFAERKDYAI